MAAGGLISIGVIAAFLCIMLSERILSLLCKAMDWGTGKVPSWEARFRTWKEQAVLVFRFVTWIIPFLIGGVLHMFMKVQSDSQQGSRSLLNCYGPTAFVRKETLFLELNDGSIRVE